MNETAGPPATVYSGEENPSGRCELLGPFALFVQGALGALALLVLLWKRARESPQRQLLVWFMDVSKQVIGGVLVHMANLLLSMLSSGTFTTEPVPASVAATTQDVSPVHMLMTRDDDGNPDDGKYHANPCSFYLLNLGIDTTLGVVILIYVLRILHKIVDSYSIPGLRTGVTSGYYGDPPRWSYWIKQSSIYFAGLMIMKFIVWLIFALFPWLGMVGDYLLKWTEGNRRLQIFFVMFFFPLVMNAFQYYVIDSFIKAKDPEQCFIEDGAPIDDHPERHHPRQSFSYREEDDDSDSEFDDGSKQLLYPGRNATPSKLEAGDSDYNPEVDGTSDHRGSPESSYFRNGGARGRIPTASSQKSRNSSMMLLPGSRGPSTPGYPDEEASVGGRSGVTRYTMADDDSTLVDRDNDR